MRISDWSSDVCSSDLFGLVLLHDRALFLRQHLGLDLIDAELARNGLGGRPVVAGEHDDPQAVRAELPYGLRRGLLDRVRDADQAGDRSEEHTSELQSLMRISYAVFCLKKKQTTYRLN